MNNMSAQKNTIENNKHLKICFIGHRKIGFGPIKERLKYAIENKIKEGCNFFTMGTHGEFDTLALNTCKELQKTYKDITIEVVITSLRKIEKQILYNDKFGKEYETSYSDVTTTMFEIEETYFKRQIIESNHKMIDGCDTLICYVNKKLNPSGAKLAMNYAKRKGLEIINLYDEKDEPTYGMTTEQKKAYYENLFSKVKWFLFRKNIWFILNIKFVTIFNI